MASNKLFVVAIDFGTTYSGYAFSTMGNRSQILTYNWSEGRTQVPKTPTSILFTPRRDFNSFGHEAEKKYAELSNSGEYKSWYFFKRFKLTLYDNKVSLIPSIHLAINEIKQQQWSVMPYKYAY